MYCKECGIVVIGKKFLCSGCEKLVQLEDEKCYSCGKKIEKTEAPKIEVNHINKEEKEEREIFIKELKKKIYGIEINYFENEIVSSLVYYPTVKLLFSDECPEELTEYYEIENKGKHQIVKLETLAKIFFNNYRTLIYAEKYAKMVLSIIAYFWIQKQYYKIADYKGILVMLKTQYRYYEQYLGMGEDLETFDSFILTFRLFIRNKDHISIKNVDGIYKKLPISETLKGAFERSKNNINAALDSQSEIQIGNQKYTRRKILQTIVYGDRAHLNKKYRPTYKEWMQNPIYKTLILTASSNILSNLLDFLNIVKNLYIKVLEGLRYNTLELL